MSSPDVVKRLNRLIKEYKTGSSQKRKNMIDKLLRNILGEKVDSVGFMEAIKQGLKGQRGGFDLSFSGDKPKPPVPKDSVNPFKIVKWRDGSISTKDGFFINIPQHVAAAGVNIGAAFVDSFNAAKSIYDLPSNLGTDMHRPNEPLPSNSNISKLLTKYS